MSWFLDKTMSWYRGGTEVFKKRSNVRLLYTLLAQKKAKFQTWIWISNLVGAKMSGWHLLIIILLASTWTFFRIGDSWIITLRYSSFFPCWGSLDFYFLGELHISHLYSQTGTYTGLASHIFWMRKARQASNCIALGTNAFYGIIYINDYICILTGLPG